MELLRTLVESGDKRLATRLESEIVSTLESLDKLDRSRKTDMAAAWHKRQQEKISTLER